MNLCGLCHEAHLRQRTTSKHNVITINELKVKHIDTVKDQNAIVPRPILKCFIHPSQDIKLYCLNCNQVCVFNCTFYNLNCIRDYEVLLLRNCYIRLPVTIARFYCIKIINLKLWQKQQSTC